MLQESPCARSPGLFNRTAGRRLCATNVTGLLHSSFVVIFTYITINLFSGLLQNICLKKSESLGESYLKQNYCHACHRRFAVFFPLPSCFFRVKTVAVSTLCSRSQN